MYPYVLSIMWYHWHLHHEPTTKALYETSLYKMNTTYKGGLRKADSNHLMFSWVAKRKHKMATGHSNTLPYHVAQSYIMLKDQGDRDNDALMYEGIICSYLFSCFNKTEFSRSLVNSLMPFVCAASTSWIQCPVVHKTSLNGKFVLCMYSL
jgi:hypothetical protein